MYKTKISPEEKIKAVEAYRCGDGSSVQLAEKVVHRGNNIMRLAKYLSNLWSRGTIAQEQATELQRGN